MKSFKILFLFFFFFLIFLFVNVFQNVYLRQYQTLNGSLIYIVDSYDNGYYDYRMNVTKNGFFKNQKARNVSDIVEYNFDTAPLIMVPGDWNTQSDKLFFYERSI